MSNRYSLLAIILLLPLMLLAKPKQKIWVIDAGHGGNDHGCETSTTREKDINLKLAKRVAELVRANLPDVKVVMTREYDKYLTLDQRCVIANNANADLFLSIHVNAAPEVNTIRGTETFYGPQGGTEDKELERLRKKNIQKSELLAWMMQKYYGIAGRPISRGVKRERYYVCLYTRMPAILTEVGFISTPSEEKYMTSKEGSEEIAQCIYRGLKDYDETVSNDKIQSTLASLRRTGGQSKQNVIPAGKGPEILLADATETPKTEPTPATTSTPATDSKTVASTTTTQTVEVKPVATATTATTVATTTAASATKTTTTNTASATKATTTTTASTTKNTTTSSASSAATSATKTEAKTPEKKEEKVEKKEEKKVEVPVVPVLKNDDKLLENTKEPEEIVEELLFSVQIFSLRAKLQPNDERFKGLKDILVVEREGLYKYLCGTTKDYAGARKLLATVRETFPDAFLVAYQGSRQISMSDAIEMLPK